MEIKELLAAVNSDSDPIIAIRLIIPRFWVLVKKFLSLVISSYPFAPSDNLGKPIVTRLSKKPFNNV